MRTDRIVSRLSDVAAAPLLSLVVPLVLAGCLGGPAPDTLPAVARDTVPVGYGSVARSHNTTAVGSVYGNDVNNPVTSVEQMLQGRLAGVDVSPDGRGGYSIRIRGKSSLNTGVSSEPLVVIDGMPVRGVVNPFVGLSPHDIERIDVLKDAAATAIYGSRGANGVILITSKRARRDPVAQ